MSLLLLCFTVSGGSATITGKVVGIAEGDTITIVNSAIKQHWIPLYDIDAPEGSLQPFGKAAKKLTAHLTYRKTANVMKFDTDKYGGTVRDETVCYAKEEKNKRRLKYGKLQIRLSRGCTGIMLRDQLCCAFSSLFVFGKNFEYFKVP